MKRMLTLAFSGLTLITAATCLADLQAGIDAYNKQDYTTAFNQFMLLAKSGDAGAQLQLGLIFDNGLGKDQDYDQAFYWYNQSANKGNAHAQFNVAEMIALGQGTEQDHSKALKWYRRAAESGFPEAQYKLGLLLSSEEHDEQDLIEAYKWLTLAAAQPAEGADAAGTLTNKLKIRMSSAEILEAKKERHNGRIYFQKNNRTKCSKSRLATHSVD